MIKKANRNIVIVAGGKGNRMGTEIPKQFLLLKDKAVLMHTMALFYQFDKTANIFLVLPESQIDYWKELTDKHQFTIQHQIIKGGAERFFSVKNALQNITEGEVWIHDGVRPLVSAKTLQNLADAIQANKAVIPTLAVEESLRKIENNKSKIVNRADYRLVQTPQVFKGNEIQKAYEQEYQKIFTDDASVYEAFGGEIQTVSGNKENIKITTKEDLLLAEYYLNIIQNEK